MLGKDKGWPVVMTKAAVVLYRGGDDLSREGSCELLGKHEGCEEMVGEE